MNSILADYSTDFSPAPRTTSRTSSAVKRPRPVGWRRDVFRDPHLQRQLIRRRPRTMFEAASEYYSSIGLVVAKLAKKKEEQKKAEALRRTFLELSKKWRDDTAFKSSVSDLVLDPSYQRILTLGSAVVPLILEELAKGPEYWFWALEAITDQNPVPEVEQGQIALMTQRWIDWGKANHVI